MIMWLLSLFSFVLVKNQKTLKFNTIYYTNFFFFYMSTTYYFKQGCFFFCPAHIIKESYVKIGLELRSILFRYTGKAYRISKRNNILHLNFHYPTFKYLNWINVKLRFKKKRKALRFYWLTWTPINVQIFNQLYKIRPQNTYTKRGIYSNLFAYNHRKPKTTIKR